MGLESFSGDLINHNKAGDVVRRLGEASGTFLESYVKINLAYASLGSHLLGTLNPITDRGGNL